MNAVASLLADHKMIRKILESFDPDSPRVGLISQTLARALKTHAWFEDEVFIPALRASPMLQPRFTDGIIQEHRDIAFLLGEILQPGIDRRMLDVHVLQFRALLESHFRKEEDALFPLAERALGAEGMATLHTEMQRRQGEAARLVGVPATGAQVAPPDTD